VPSQAVKHAAASTSGQHVARLPVPRAGGTGGCKPCWSTSTTPTPKVRCCT